jgi:hypothetical protein
LTEPRFDKINSKKGEKIMKKPVPFFYFILALFLAAALVGSIVVQSYGNSPKASCSFLDIPSPPPQSLDALYPPKSEQPVYLFSMLDMEGPFNGIIIDLMEEDFVNAGANYEKFKQKYISLSKLIPEWENDFPMQPVDELGTSMQNGDKGKIMSSIEEVGKACNGCHLQNMVKVQQKYHWRDFEEIKVTDLVTKESVGFNQLMQFISMNFSGIGVNLEEGQVENAKKHFDQFKTRFTSLKASCTHCHTTQRKYYVDESVQSYIDELGSALGESSVDPQKIAELSMKIGQENCEKCHLVHLPAALTKLGWKVLDSNK